MLTTTAGFFEVRQNKERVKGHGKLSINDRIAPENAW